MRSGTGLLIGICIVFSVVISRADEQNAPAFLPKMPSRLKPVTVVIALEVPLIDEEPAVLKQSAVVQAVALEPATKRLVAPASSVSTTPDDKPAPVVPSWTVSKPEKKTNSAPVPITNPYIKPRTVK